jgi:hypothetical protein
MAGAPVKGEPRPAVRGPFRWVLINDGTGQCADDIPEVDRAGASGPGGIRSRDVDQELLVEIGVARYVLFRGGTTDRVTVKRPSPHTVVARQPLIGEGRGFAFPLSNRRCELTPDVRRSTHGWQFDVDRRPLAGHSSRRDSHQGEGCQREDEPDRPTRARLLGHLSVNSEWRAPARGLNGCQGDAPGPEG